MTEQEEMALRELAAKPHYIAKVQDVLGPLSLWSSQGLQDHVRKAVEAAQDRNKVALQEWLDKTQWVQDTALPVELGMHRADVLKARLGVAVVALQSILNASLMDKGHWAKTIEREAADALAMIQGDLK